MWTLRIMHCGQVAAAATTLNAQWKRLGAHVPSFFNRSPAGSETGEPAASAPLAAPHGAVPHKKTASPPSAGAAQDHTARSLAAPQLIWQPWAHANPVSGMHELRAPAAII
jgi:hypothetical protein